MRFRDRFARFMYGRNGTDQLAQAESVLVLILVIVGLFLRSSLAGSILYLITLALFIHLYFRMFSKNLAKRQRENDWFMGLTDRFRRNKGGYGSYGYQSSKADRAYTREQKKLYKYFKCPMCSQKVRVPRGHGKICITCPKCRQEFVRKS